MKRTHGNSVAGQATFVLARGISPFITYGLLTRSFGTSVLDFLHLKTPSSLQVLDTPAFTQVNNNYLHLTPKPTLLVVAASLSAFKHSYWVLFRNFNTFSPGAALGVSIYNFLSDSLNTLVGMSVLATDGGRGELGPMQYIGAAMFVLGLGIEAGAEETRWNFKRKVQNKGKLDDTGLFGLVRHPNYLGYTMWRVGASMISGSVYLTLGALAVNLGMFMGSSIEELSSHMSKRYGADWTAYQRRVPYKMIPYVY